MNPTLLELERLSEENEKLKVANGILRTEVKEL